LGIGVKNGMDAAFGCLGSLVDNDFYFLGQLSRVGELAEFTTYLKNFLWGG
jgi:hypothetical protein